jgi:hypothetical protein
MGSFIRFSSSSIVSIPSRSSIILHVLIRVASSQSPPLLPLRLPFHCNNRKDFARYRPQGLSPSFYEYHKLRKNFLAT